MIRRILKFAVLIFSALAAAGVVILVFLFCLMPYFEPDPMEELRQQTPARIWTDEQGRLLHVRRTFDAQWRFEIELREVSPAVIGTMLAVEDRNFYRHHGIDLFAAGRAFSQNFRHGRIVSGASTITMQLAGMTEIGPRRSVFRKIRQMMFSSNIRTL